MFSIVILVDNELQDARDREYGFGSVDSRALWLIVNYYKMLWWLTINSSFNFYSNNPGVNHLNDMQWTWSSKKSMLKHELLWRIAISKLCLKYKLALISYERKKTMHNEIKTLKIIAPHHVMCLMHKHLIN